MVLFIKRKLAFFPPFCAHLYLLNFSSVNKELKSSIQWVIQILIWYLTIIASLTHFHMISFCEMTEPILWDHYEGNKKITLSYKNSTGEKDIMIFNISGDQSIWSHQDFKLFPCELINSYDLSYFLVQIWIRRTDVNMRHISNSSDYSKNNLHTCCIQDTLLAMHSVLIQTSLALMWIIALWLFYNWTSTSTFSPF